MQNELSDGIHVGYAPEFKRNLRGIAKKYRHIRSDVQPVIDQLEAGNVIGDQVSRADYSVFKVRARNRDIQKGKRSGYRLIYYLKTPTDVILVTIYSKLDQGDVSPERIRRIIAEFKQHTAKGPSPKLSPL